MKRARRQPVVLTERGERVVAVAYGCGIAFATMFVILGALLIAGAIEGAP